MIVLGVEGARLPAGVSLLRVDEEEGSVEVGALAQVEKGPSTSGSLLLAMQAVLEHSNSSLDEVAVLAVGIGPGSWTGLRVTLSLVKTLAQARQIALVGVPSFDALAQAVWRARSESEEGEEEGEEDQARAHRMLLVVGECRPGELYAKLFESSEDYIVAAQDEWIATPASLLDSLWTQALSRHIESPPLIVCAQGDPARDIMKRACEDQDEEAVFATVDAPAAALEVALAALERLAQGEADDALSLTPLYLAPSSAERVRFGL